MSLSYVTSERCHGNPACLWQHVHVNYTSLSPLWPGVATAGRLPKWGHCVPLHLTTSSCYTAVSQNLIRNYISKRIKDLADLGTLRPLSASDSSLHICNGLDAQFKLMGVCLLQTERVAVILHLTKSRVSPDAPQRKNLAGFWFGIPSFLFTWHYIDFLCVTEAHEHLLARCYWWCCGASG